MKAIKQTATVIGIAVLLRSVALENIGLVSIIITFILASVTGALLTTFSMAGEKPIGAIPCFFFLFMAVLWSPANEVPAHLAAIALGLGIGAAAIFGSLIFSTNDEDDN